jgi:DNA invertase Pin-like site-specific DNA recombinase
VRLHPPDGVLRTSRNELTIQILDMAVDTSTPQGLLTFNLFASIAQFERENM